jgi:hypothetical protein
MAWPLLLTANVCHHPATEKGGNPDIVRESQKRRYADVGLVDKVVALDADWRAGEGGGGGAAVWLWWCVHGKAACQSTHSRRQRRHPPPASRQRPPSQLNIAARVCHCCLSALPPLHPPVRYDLDQAKKEFNALVKQIGDLRKVGGWCRRRVETWVWWCCSGACAPAKRQGGSWLAGGRHSL